MPREQLPPRRAADTIVFPYLNDARMPVADITLTVGYYPGEGALAHRIGEVFMSTTKIGTMLDTAARDTAVLLSLLLQYGCGVRHIRQALTERADGSAEGLAGQVCDILLAREKELAATLKIG